MSLSAHILSRIASRIVIISAMRRIKTKSNNLLIKHYKTCK